jgi:hypothetical protein
METKLDQYQILPTETPFMAFHPRFSSDKEVAHLLTMTLEWVRSHADEIPGLQRLGNHYRFRSNALEQWLGSLEIVLQPEEAADMLCVETSWIYADADEIPGILRLGRYVRFRRSVLSAFVAGSETCQ